MEQKWNPNMNESKIVAAKRLQSEGLWNEASLYREEVREHLRDEGMTRGFEVVEQSFARIRLRGGYPVSAFGRAASY
jgi:hypothetical protein